jgi:hypothetical protein
MRFCLILLMLVFAVDLRAQGQSRSRIDVPVIDKGPVIDGDLSDPAWKHAAFFDELTQVEPVEGIPADPKTRILLIRDSRCFYVAFECFEPSPEMMVVKDMKRDGSMAEDESVKIVLDTFSTGRTGIFLVLSAAGGKLDALMTDNGKRMNISWDAVWEGKTRILADRWIAEIAIPFDGLSFPVNDVWRINFERYHGARRAYYRWCGARRHFSVFTISELGEISGFAGIQPGLGLEITPYFKTRYHDSHVEEREFLKCDSGGEINWKITTQMNATLSLNTDFAETEVDMQRVNLSRFGITFPEKRDFFLRDSNLFEFGWESGFSGGANIVPFRSRRIGLAPDGSEVPMEYSVKLAGKAGPWSLGFIGAHTGALSSTDTPEADLFVLRPSFGFSEKLSIGGVFTHGNPAADRESFTSGIDMSYSDSDLTPGLLQLNAWTLRTENDQEKKDAGHAFGIRGTLRTADWNYSLISMSSESTFNPALGYVNRPGESLLSGSVGWTPRPENSGIRNYSWSLSPSMWTGTDGNMVSSSLSTTLFGFSLHSGDSFSLVHHFNTDKLTADYVPVEGSVVAADDHIWQDFSMTAGFSRTRDLSGSISATAGEWYDGRIVGYGASAIWMPNSFLSVTSSYNENRIEIPASSFVTHVEKLTLGVSFCPELRVDTLVQHDNVSDNIGFQGMLRYTHGEGRELFFVANMNWVEERDGTIVPLTHDVIVKVQYSFRF